MNNYQELAYRTAPADSSNIKTLHSLVSTDFELIHAQLGIASEAGELADALKKYLVYKQPLDIENVHEEVGDIFWYCCLALTALGKDLDKVMEHNIAKLKLRYPEKFTEKDALERKDKQHNQCDKCFYLNSKDATLCVNCGKFIQYPTIPEMIAENVKELCCDICSGQHSTNDCFK